MRDLVGPIPVEVASADNRTSGVGPSNLIPLGEGSVADRLKPGIATGCVAEENIVGAITEEIRYTGDRIVGIGPTNLIPAGKTSVADRLDSGVTGRIVTE